jgi:hypothetical protein
MRPQLSSVFRTDVSYRHRFAVTRADFLARLRKGSVVGTALNSTRREFSRLKWQRLFHNQLAVGELQAMAVEKTPDFVQVAAQSG